MRFDEDDIRTAYAPPDDDATFVFGMGEVPVQGASPIHRAWLLRVRTNERIEVPMPAVVGRGTLASVHVRGNPVISRRHIALRSDGDRVLLTDLSSRNGTRVRGRRVPPNTPVAVRDGDQICLASEEFVLHVS